MRILVTGSEGFVGSHLTKTLRERRHTVTGVDRHAATYRRDLRESIADVLDEVRPEIVIHLAAQVGRLFGEDDMATAVSDNALATTLLARDCGERGIRIAYASTSEVYGDRGDQVCREDDSLDVLPHNLYGLTKRWGEEAICLYTEDPLIFRFSMPYGPGVAPGRGRRALDTIIWQAHHRKRITVHRGAERSWCWIGDTVAGVVRLVEGSHDGVFNIGRDDDPYTMLWLATRACRMTEAPLSLIDEVSPPPRQTVVKRLSTEKLRALGWEPTVGLEYGMREVYRWVANFGPNGEFFGEAA